VGTRDWLPPASRKYVRYFVSLIVVLGAGTSPLWGGDKIPGFRSILNLFPQDLQDLVIPSASVLMCLPAVGAEFFAGRTKQLRRIDQKFGVTFVIVSILILVLFGVYKETVIRINVPGANQKVAYLIGETMLPTCPCLARGLDIRECVGTAISTNPEAVAACYPMSQIARRSITLSVLFMLMMLGLGILVALLVLTKERGKTA